MDKWKWLKTSRPRQELTSNLVRYNTPMCNFVQKNPATNELHYFGFFCTEELMVGLVYGV